MSSSRALQAYEGEEVTVTFDARLCIHSEECLRGLPAVVASVARCPSGALRVIRRGEVAVATSTEGAVITVSRDGPLLLRGRLHIENAAGETIATADAAALCRCGATANPPFCDGSHLRIGFVRP